MYIVRFYLLGEDESADNACRCSGGGRRRIGANEATPPHVNAGEGEANNASLHVTSATSEAVARDPFGTMLFSFRGSCALARSPLFGWLALSRFRSRTNY